MSRGRKKKSKSKMKQMNYRRHIQQKERTHTAVARTAFYRCRYPSNGDVSTIGTENSSTSTTRTRYGYLNTGDTGDTGADSSASLCMDLDDFNDSDPLRRERLDNVSSFNPPNPTGWFVANSLTLQPVWSVSKDVFRWCSNGLSQGVEIAKDMVFPSRRYQRQLEITLDRLQNLEQQLLELKTNKLVNGADQSKYVMCLECKCHVSNPSAILPHESTDLRCQSAVTSLPLGVSGPALAPPPPPPPPIKPPPMALNHIINKIKSNGPAKKPDKGLVVTLADIKNVKLRKVTENKSLSNKKVKLQGQGQTLVSVSDLKSLQLRKIQSQLDQENRQRLPQEVLLFQNKLRKVNVRRSPGGTPMPGPDHTRPTETGDGLTPIMTRALKKKFLFARSSSRSPKRQRCDDLPFCDKENFMNKSPTNL